MFYIYVLRSKKDGRFYSGFTSDLKKRIKLHNEGKIESTKTRRTLVLIYYEACWHKTDALMRERYLKTTYGHRYIRNRLRHHLMTF